MSIESIESERGFKVGDIVKLCSETPFKIDEDSETEDDFRNWTHKYCTKELVIVSIGEKQGSPYYHLSCNHDASPEGYYKGEFLLVRKIEQQWDN